MENKLLAFSERKKSALNIVGVLVLVAINALINFFLTPFITEHLGVEANGYIMLANNFITYFGLITTAFSSMSGRFILVADRQGRDKDAVEYYSSVYFGNLVIAVVLAIPAALIVVFLPNIISIDGISVDDARILFAVTFANFFIGLIVPQWDCATYVTNNLYLRSLKNAVGAVIRALSIMLLFWFLSPHAQFVAIGGLVSAVVGLAMAFGFKRVLMPDLKVSISRFKLRKVKELVSSGIWNSVSQCGNLLLEGLDLLIANIFISATASGVLSVAKIIPNMVNQIIGNIATTFGPSVTRLYADNDMDGIVKAVRNDMGIVAVLSSLPSGIAVAYGVQFFSLWVPSQDADELMTLMTITVIGVFVTGVAKCMTNVFGALNKLRTNSLVVIASGLLSTSIVFVLLSTTNLGVYAIAGVSSAIALIREFGFTATYTAHLLRKPWHTFMGSMFRGCAALAICVAVGFAISAIIVGDTWLSLIMGVIVAAALSLIAEFAILLNKQEKTTMLKILHLAR